MKTTELIVELLVIGMGTLISISLIVHLFWIEPNLQHSFKIQTFYILPILVLSYVFGILTDRVSDWFFSKVENNMKVKILGMKSDLFQQIRTKVYDSSPSLHTWFIYSRTRLRIVRGWSINFIVMSGTLVIAIFFKGTDLSEIYLFLLITCSFCSLLSITSYHKLLKSEYLRLKNSYDQLINCDKK